jgi:hypothetical protein
MGDQHYLYDEVPTSVALGNANGTVLAAASNVNVGQITQIISQGITSVASNWATMVTNGTAPVFEDGTYGNFGAALFGDSSLATVLAQLPIGDRLANGFIIQSGGVSASVGTLTIGLEPTLLQQWENTPGVSVLDMNPSGSILPNPDGNAQSVLGYTEAQVTDGEIILQSGTNSQTIISRVVLDTGGGNANTIFNTGTPDLSEFIQGDESTGTLANGVTYELLATNTSGALSTIFNYLTGPDALPTGGNTVVSSNDQNSDNSGISLFYNDNVMFDLADGLVLLDPIACFVEGTLIDTEHGPVAVEHLRVGDRVTACLAQALLPIKWIGHRLVDCRHHPKPETVWPVRIRAGCFGDNRPSRDLLLSPDHAVLVDGVLIPAKYLVNGTSIVRCAIDRVTYFHLELPQHDVVLAEGLPAESYLDTGSRLSFANGGVATRLFADFSTQVWEAAGCAPLVVAGSQLQAVRRRLRERAARQEERGTDSACYR